MRIVHAASNIAGIPYMLMERQRQMGYQVSAVLYPYPFETTPKAIDLDRLLRGNRLTRKLRRARTLAWVAQTYDIVHFHFHTTFMRHHEDVAVLKALGKRIVFHLHGCDIRDPRRVRVEHPISACAECSIQCLTDVKLSLPRAIARYADAVIVATPDLMEFVPQAQYLPNPVDADAWSQVSSVSQGQRERSGELVIVHAPTNRQIKGTKYIESAVAQLQAERLPVRLLLLEGLSRDAVRRACIDADLAVDQVLVGWIGVFALEMMALGKPVVAYIRPDLRCMAPDLPVAEGDPRVLVDTLRSLLTSSQRRADLADRGPAYVRAHHDPDTYTRRIVELYEEIGMH